MAEHREDKDKESFITKLNSLNWYWKITSTVILFFTIMLVIGTIAGATGATESCP